MEAFICNKRVLKSPIALFQSTGQSRYFTPVHALFGEDIKVLKSSLIYFENKLRPKFWYLLAFISDCSG